MIKRSSQLLILVIVVLALPALVAAQGEKTVIDILADDGRFTTLLAAIERTETQEAFSEGHWTLFAPTDDAFARLGLSAETLDTRLTLQETADLLLYQAMTKEVTEDDAMQMLGDVTMANGWAAGLKWYDGTLWVNDEARVSEADQLAANGVVHVVDAVITPPWPRTAEESEVGFMAAVQEARLLQADEEAETSAEIEDTEAVQDEASPAVSEADVEESFTIPQGSLLDVMAQDGRFKTYLEAVGFLDLVEPYSEGTWTIFAPTDEAFAAAGLDAENITSETSIGELADLLLYHAVDEEVTLDKAKTMLGDVIMRNGQLAGLKWFDGALWVNDHARVVDADIRASNGVIHALDRVIERPWPLVENPESSDAIAESMPSGVIP